MTSPPLLLHVGNCKVRIVRYGKFHHVSAVLKGDLPVEWLMGRGRRRDEEDPVQAEPVEGRFGDSQVRIVDWVEGAAKYADFHKIRKRRFTAIPASGFMAPCAT